MQRLFFHNPHDRWSREALASIPEDVKVITMFQKDTVIPEGIQIRSVPLMVDKQLQLLTNPPYYTGGFVLQFQLQDYLGNPIKENHLFYLDINGERFSEVVEDDLLVLELFTEAPTSIEIEINSEGFMPWKGEILCEQLPSNPVP